MRIIEICGTYLSDNMLSKRKGDIAELKVMLYLEENGYNVLTPFGDKARYDLVAEKDGVFERIQVKYRTLSDGNVLLVDVASNTKVNGCSKRSIYTEDEIDSIIVYCPDTDSLYKLDMDDIRGIKTAISLRVNPKTIAKNMRNASDYEL